jgi:NAD(P)H-flavin reductase
LTTNYLANLTIGDKVEIRGPKGAMKYNKDYSKSILMISGGTGITPVYQLIRAICTDDSDNTIVKLLYANHSEEDILLKEQLDSFAAKCPKKFNIEYVLEGEDWVRDARSNQRTRTLGFERYQGYALRTTSNDQRHEEQCWASGLPITWCLIETY